MTDATQHSRPLRVAVLGGGPGAEREISIESARSVTDALTTAGHDVIPIELPDFSSGATLETYRAQLDITCDVVFPVLHGTFGEDGGVQRLLDELDLPYVGSGASASTVCIDKGLTKDVVRALGFATPESRVLEEHDDATDIAQFGAPAVIKPVDQGSSVHTFVCQTPQEIPAAVATVRHLYGRALVERYVAGTELTVSIVLGETLPVVFIRPFSTFYDFAAKYRDTRTEYLFEAGYPADVHQRVQSMSLSIYEEIGCRHLARVDWLIDDQAQLWFLEVNTMPGFTTHSLLPMAAAKAGSPLPQLVDQLARAAVGARS